MHSDLFSLTLSGNSKYGCSSNNNHDSTATKPFPYTETWKDDFKWANPSPLGEQYTYCSSCRTDLHTFEKGYIELNRHKKTKKHKKNAKRLQNGDPKSQDSELLPCSDAAVRFIHSHCYTETSKAGEAAKQFVRCKLGLQYPEDIKSVCQHSPYCVYICGGVIIGKNDSVSVVLVGYFDVEASSHRIRFLDAVQSVEGPGETVAAVVQTLKKFDLSTANLVLAVSLNCSGEVSEQICSQLRELNPNILALGGLYTVADAACHAGVKEISSQAQEFMVELNAHYSSCCTKNEDLKMLFGSEISENSKPFYLNTSCLRFCQFVTKLLEMWTDLTSHFITCHKDKEQAKLICSQLKDPKLKATFMFLEHALKPLQNYQRETQAASLASMPLILEKASTLLETYTSYFLQPHPATRYLKDHSAEILQNKKFHLSSHGLNLAGKDVEDLLKSSEIASSLTQLNEEALSFYMALTARIAEELPLGDTVLKSIAQLLNSQNSLNMTKAAVEELGTKLGVCSSPEEVKELKREFQEYQLLEKKGSEDKEKDNAALVALEKYWTRVLKDTKPDSVFRKLILTLLSFPCPPLDAQQVFTQVCY